ncbi:MAG: hypothetical protein PVJ51_04780 [Acidobacteriota bacterium]|jgi:hypothetical protein
MRITVRSLAAALVALMIAGNSAAQDATWLPPEIAEGAAQQLADRMRLLPELLGGESPDDERVLVGTRQMIGAIADVLESWGSGGVLERAPELAALNVPSTGDQYLDAMAHYQVCNLLLYLQLEDPAYNEDLDTRITSVFGLSAITLAVLSLREPFLAAGGTPAAVEAHLSGPTLEPALQSLQSDADARAAAEADCQPVVVALLEEPLSGLGRER